jgi:hypothetical protein
LLNARIGTSFRVNVNFPFSKYQLPTISRDLQTIRARRFPVDVTNKPVAPVGYSINTVHISSTSMLWNRPNWQKPRIREGFPNNQCNKSDLMRDTWFSNAPPPSPFHVARQPPLA